MITKTLNLDDAYQELFDEVREKSNGAIDVDNLDAFYGSIEEIAAVDPKFLRLPLDEPLFDIDANTRKITVPAEFKANGVSVQKDHLAEVIFFRIERYFDYTDLSTCNIVINWKMGSKEGKTTRFIKFEKVFTIDETKASYIVFGWPINDVVTDKSGQLTFAVEFFKTEGSGEEQKVIYRFNTLPVSVNIKDGLVIDETIEPVELDDDIRRTLVNSKFGDGTAAVGDIVWLTGDGQGLVVGEGTGTDVVLKDFSPIVNLNTTIIGGVPTSDTVSLYAEGFVDAGTQIRYTDANNNTLTAEALKVNRPRVKVEYDANNTKLYYESAIATDPLSAEAAVEAEELWVVDDLDETLKYYKLDNENALIEATAEDLAKWGSAEAVELYVIVAKIDVTNAGSYVIKAQGYKMGTDGDDNTLHKIGNGDVRATATVVVPEAEVPSAIEVDVTPLGEVDEGYTFNEEQTQNVVFLNASGEGALTASAVVDNFGALQFSWLKKLESDTAFSPVSEEEVAFQDTNENTLNISESGQYKVSVVNFQNGAAAQAVESAVITASALAGKINSAVVKAAIGSGNFINIPASGINFNSAGRLSVNSVTLKVDAADIEIDGQVGTLEFEWYKEVMNEELESSWELIEGANTDQLRITYGDGTYLPVVKNNYNGSVYTFILNKVVVNDAAA